MDIEKRRELFQEWYLALMGKDQVHMLTYSRTTGYSDELVNALWIGFNAGAEAVLREDGAVV